MDNRQLQINEIKKALYKEKPIANLLGLEKGIATYVCVTSLGEVYFAVPFKDMGETPFLLNMEAQLLIRWITTKTK